MARLLAGVVVVCLLFHGTRWYSGQRGEAGVVVAAIVVASILAAERSRAHLFEIGGNTIWALALLHAAVQGTVKIVEIVGPSASLLPIVWMAASAVIPFIAFVLPRPLAGSRGALQVTGAH